MQGYLQDEALLPRQLGAGLSSFLQALQLTIVSVVILKTTLI
jgi:hypothetical protein